MHLIFFYLTLFSHWFVALLGLHCCPGSALAAVSVLLPSCGVQASHCRGFSCCTPRALEHAAFNSTASRPQQPWFPGPRAQTQQLRHVGLAACGIFSDQRSNACLLHWQADSLPEGHQGSPLKYIFFFPSLSFFFWDSCNANVGMLKVSLEIS